MRMILGRIFVEAAACFGPAGSGYLEANTDLMSVRGVLQAKKKFLAWADSEAGIEVSPDIDLFHAFAEVRRMKTECAT